MRHFLLVAVSLLVGCSGGEARLDTSNEESFQKSVAAMAASLPEADRSRLPQALLSLAMADLADSKAPLAALAELSTAGTGGLLARLGTNHAGKTAVELLQAADDLAEARRVRQLSALDEQIAQLRREMENSAEAAAAAALVLDKIKISRAIYRWSDASFMDEPIVSFEIKNDTDFAIKLVRMHAIVETAGRSIPWIDAPISYQFPGGLEPGEVQQLDLAPNRFMNGWGNADLKERTDLILTLTVTAVSNAGDEEVSRVDAEDVERNGARLNEMVLQRSELSEQLLAE